MFGYIQCKFCRPLMFRILNNLCPSVITDGKFLLHLRIWLLLCVNQVKVTWKSSLHYLLIVLYIKQSLADWDKTLHTVQTWSSKKPVQPKWPHTKPESNPRGRQGSQVPLKWHWSPLVSSCWWIQDLITGMLSSPYFCYTPLFVKSPTGSNGQGLKKKEKTERIVPEIL